MLVLKRRVGERIRLSLPGGDWVWVTVVKCDYSPGGGKVVVLGFDAPEHVVIQREELIGKGNDAPQTP